MHRTPHELQTSVVVGTNSVNFARKHIALRVPTLTPAGESLPGGHCYLILPVSIPAYELVGEKVRAELRKFKAGGSHQSTLEQLVGPDCHLWYHNPQAENVAAAEAVIGWRAGNFSILIDGELVTDLDALISVTRTTSIGFVIAAPVLA